MTSSHALIKHMMSTLFVAEERRLDGVITRLNRENKRKQEDPWDGFLYSGELYMPVNFERQAHIPGRRRNILDPEFHEEMELYIKDKKLIMDDRLYLSQIFFKLLYPCETHQHIRDALPDCVTDCTVPEIIALERRDEEAWTIKNDERAMRQYLKFLPRMEVYSAARLFY